MKSATDSQRGGLGVTGYKERDRGARAYMWPSVSTWGGSSLTTLLFLKFFKIKLEKNNNNSIF